MDSKANSPAKKRLVIGMSGASGAVLGIILLQILKENPQWETHLIISGGAEQIIAQETGYHLKEVTNLADKFYDIKNIGAGLASGTFKTEGMIIIPCSIASVYG